MPDWMIWMVIAFAIMGCSRGCGRAVQGYGRRHRERMSDRREEMRTVGAGAHPQLAEGPPEWATPSARTPRQRAPSRPRETPLQALQRRFVEGSLSLEQYESEVDKLERIE